MSTHNAQLAGKPENEMLKYHDIDEDGKMTPVENPPEVGLSTAERVVILQRICEAKPRIEPFRSGGFMNKDYDMARIAIDLPIVEAKKLMAALKAI